MMPFLKGSKYDSNSPMTNSVLSVQRYAIPHAFITGKCQYLGTFRQFAENKNCDKKSF
jgi:hypothetical protein